MVYGPCSQIQFETSIVSQKSVTNLFLTLSFIFSLHIQIKLVQRARFEADNVQSL